MTHVQTRSRRPLVALSMVVLVALTACLAPDGTVQVITLAGSPTTEPMMDAIVAAENADAAWNTDPDLIVNLRAQELVARSVPGDAHCVDRTYRTPGGPGIFPTPNGSTQGLDSLRSSVSAGDACVDAARSTSGPRAPGFPDPATFEYYAYALDAVGWSSASSKAPANLTLNQLKGIYNCTFTNWAQVGGSPGPIQRYWPYPIPDAVDLATSDLLGFDPTLFAGPQCPTRVDTLPNSGQLIAANGHQESAIAIFSSSSWIAQARGAQPDERAGQTIRDLNGQNLIVFPGGVATPNTAPGPIRESNVRHNNPTPAYPGVRYVWNVTDSTIADYEQVLRYIGFENRANVEPAYAMASPLCSGTRASLIEAFGFVPLDGTPSPQNLPGTRCRRYAP